MGNFIKSLVNMFQQETVTLNITRRHDGEESIHNCYRHLDHSEPQSPLVWHSLLISCTQRKSQHQQHIHSETIVADQSDCRIAHGMQSAHGDLKPSRQKAGMAFYPHHLLRPPLASKVVQSFTLLCSEA